MLRKTPGLAAIVVTTLALGIGASSAMFGVAPTDPVTYAAVIGLFGLITLIACYVPARRASRIDPITALRCE